MIIGPKDDDDDWRLQALIAEDKDHEQEQQRTYQDGYTMKDENGRSKELGKNDKRVYRRCNSCNAGRGPSLPA
jgi:hypothetical protein